MGARSTGCRPPKDEIACPPALGCRVAVGRQLPKPLLPFNVRTFRVKINDYFDESGSMIRLHWRSCACDHSYRK